MKIWTQQRSYHVLFPIDLRKENEHKKEKNNNQLQWIFSIFVYDLSFCHRVCSCLNSKMLRQRSLSILASHRATYLSNSEWNSSESSHLYSPNFPHQRPCYRRHPHWCWWIIPVANEDIKPLFEKFCGREIVAGNPQRSHQVMEEAQFFQLTT